MTPNEMIIAIKFAKTIKSKYELKLLEFLIDNNSSFTGSYRLLAEEVTGNYKNASNIRNTAMELKNKNYISVETERGKDGYNTVLRLNPHWTNEIMNAKEN